MDEALLRKQLAGLRTGLATPSLVEPITVEACEGGWIVRLGIGGVTLAKSPRRAMVYVRDRRRLARTADDDSAARGAGVSEE